VQVLLALLLAFLLASTPARNSDLWLHLATGRAIAEGTWRFGPAPFLFNDGQPAVVHCWLFDLLAYAVYSTFGGAALVVVKALLCVAVAVVLIRLAGGGAGSAMAASVVLVAMGARLALQPVLVSYLFLALTLWLLERPRRRRSLGQPLSWLGAYGPLVVLFAAWVNLDDWFWLGPATVALYLVGELLAEQREATRLAALALALAAGLLACLASPWHVHGLTLPQEVDVWRSGALREDFVLGSLFVSVWDEAFLAADAAQGPAGWAAALLVLLGLLSFILGPRHLRSWRFPVWLGLLLLAVWRARAIPFFAIAAGPILVLNFRESIRLPEAGRLDWARLGRAAAIPAALGLLIAAWPGWLQGRSSEVRGWEAAPDLVLAHAAGQLHLWREGGLLPDDAAGFAFSPEAANHLAWSAPDRQNFLDARLSGPVAECVAVRRALLGRGNPEDVRGFFRSHKVNHLILYDPDRQRLGTVFARLTHQPAEWPLLYLGGQVVLFGWRDPLRPQVPDRFAGLLFDLDREAYGAGHQVPLEPNPRDPEPRTPWDIYLHGHAPRSPETGTAALCVIKFDLETPSILQDRGRAWPVALLAAGVGGQGTNTLASGVTQGLFSGLVATERWASEDGAVLPLAGAARELKQNYRSVQDDAPPELLLLAVRAARRALEVNPDDALAHLALGEAYLRLAGSTRERAWRKGLPYLQRLRHVQTAAAFHNALRLQPDLVRAHEGLVFLYQDMGCLDLTLEHLREVVRASRTRGRLPGESTERALVRLADQAGRLEHLEKEVAHRVKRWEANSARMSVLDRARRAEEEQLSGQALAVFLDQPDLAGAAGKRGVEREVHLLLTAGRAEEARAWLTPDLEEYIGPAAYQWLRAQIAAARGDSAAADAALAAMTPPDQIGEGSSGPITARQAIAMTVAEGVTRAHLADPVRRYGLYFPLDLPALLGRMHEMADILRRQAETNAFRARLALEAGNVVHAEALLRQALSVSQGGGSIDFFMRPEAERLLGKIAAAR
jgi:hypothetical protein